MPVQQLAKNRRLAKLYEADETAWLETMSRLITERKLDRLDYDNLATYLEDMAERDRREVASRLKQLMLHVLKWVYQRDQRTRSWLETIDEQRGQLQDLLTSRVLEAHARSRLLELYPRARKLALRQTGLPDTAIPEEMPFSIEQMLSDEWPEDLVWRPKRRKNK
ncbi:MAG TPA: DUF29 domain-containing protein [Gemmataceae bacterium]|nr:DUF29 domain-containing protein [Gemmataceae bacterium]